MKHAARLSFAGFATLMAFALSGCRDSTAAPADTANVVSEVHVSPATAVMGVGTTVQFTVSVLASESTNRTVTWSSSDSTVARVDQSGTVTGVSAGRATIVARSNENPAVSG